MTNKWLHSDRRNRCAFSVSSLALGGVSHGVRHREFRRAKSNASRDVMGSKCVDLGTRQ